MKINQNKAIIPKLEEHDKPFCSFSSLLSTSLVFREPPFLKCAERWITEPDFSTWRLQSILNHLWCFWTCLKGPKSSFITPEKRAKLRSNPVKVHFAEEVEFNGHSQVSHQTALPFRKKLNLVWHISLWEFLCHTTVVCIDLNQNSLNWPFNCKMHLAK